MAEAVKILMLEHSPTDAELVERLLKKGKMNFEFFLAMNKNAFLLALDEFQPDVILADNSLPQFNATEALKIIQQRADHIPFILVTGTVSEEFAAGIIKSGADDYILKDRLGKLPATIVAALQKKKSETTIKHNDETRKLIMNSALDAIICIDKSGTITVWNPQAEKMFGWKEHEIIGRQLVETIIPEKHRQSHNTGFSHYLKTGEGPILNKVIEIEALNRSGVEFAIELTIVPIKQNDREFFCAFIRDINQRKKSEEQLFGERNLLRTVIDNLPDYIYAKDTKSNYIISNLAHVELIGAYSEEEIIGKNVLALFGPEVASVNLDEDRKVITLGEPVINRDEPITTQRGKNLWLLTTKVPLKDKDGNITGLIGISRDITERKKAEEELRQINEDLRSLSSHLQNVREEERIQIARDIHDDLGQQLTGLKMDVTWLNQKLVIEDVAVREKMDSMIELIDETVKSVRRISSNLRPSILDDLGLIAALEWHSEEVEKRSEIKVNFSAEMPEPDIPVAMATGIFRIYQEVLTNAVRHANAHVITSSLQLKDDNLLLKIKDDGQGMDPAITGSKKTLGLIGIKERTFVLGGKFDLKSGPGKGTEVQISVPLRKTQ